GTAMLTSHATAMEVRQPVAAADCSHCSGACMPSRAGRAAGGSRSHAYSWLIWFALSIIVAPLQADEYRLGSGDVVRIAVYNNPDLATEAQISQDGQISFPLIGGIAIGGLTKGEAEKSISQRLGAGGFVPNAFVNLLVTQYRSQQ